MKYDRRPAPRLGWPSRIDCIALTVGYTTIVVSAIAGVLALCIHWSN